MNRINVFIVDDNPADRYLAERAFAESGVSERIVEFTDGDAVLEVLSSRLRFEEVAGNCPPYTVVLLDINMPRMSGMEVLARLARQEAPVNRCARILIYTSSDNERDREEAQAFGFVGGYVLKPLIEFRQVAPLLADLLAD